MKTFLDGFQDTMIYYRNLIHKTIIEENGTCLKITQEK